MKPTVHFPFIEGQRVHHDCERCTLGTYAERSIYNDWDSTYTCEICGHDAPAYYRDDEKQHYIVPTEEDRQYWKAHGEFLITHGLAKTDEVEQEEWERLKHKGDSAT